jgi:uncharacterized membrane protein YcaP (DUF421 family)
MIFGQAVIMDNIFFDNWESIIRTISLTILGYISMVLLLRVSGKRTLSKMNAFDFVITVALGSSLATLSLSKDVTLADGFTAFALLMLLQFLFTHLSVRYKKFRSLITNDPTLLFYNGAFLHESMKQQRITEEEIYSSSRLKGVASLDHIEAIIMETTGELSIIEKKPDGLLNTVAHVNA